MPTTSDTVSMSSASSTGHSGHFRMQQRTANVSSSYNHSSQLSDHPASGSTLPMSSMTAGSRAEEDDDDDDQLRQIIDRLIDEEVGCIVFFKAFEYSDQKFCISGVNFYKAFFIFIHEKSFPQHFLLYF